MGGILCWHEIYFFFSFFFSKFYASSDFYSMQAQQSCYFFNHYQMGPIVLYYSCRLVVRFCLIHQVFVFRLLFNESMQRFFFNHYQVGPTGFIYRIVVGVEVYYCYYCYYYYYYQERYREFIELKLLFFIFFCLFCPGGGIRYFRLL